jgi:predicted nucleic acid-binding protein
MNGMLVSDHPVQTFILDSWPVLEWLQGKQPTAERLSAFLRSQVQRDARLLMTRINYGEIIYMLPKKFSGQRLLQAQIITKHLPVEKVSIDDLLVDEATELKKRYACSYADCFAVALAMREKAPVVTGDPEFLKLRDAGLIRLEWMGA